MSSQSLLAQSPPHPVVFPAQLQPAEAEYRVVVNGIPLGLNATVRLTREAPHYQLHFLIENRLFRHEERATFSWRDCNAKPLHYQHASAGFGIRREGEIRFDWETGQARGSQSVYPLVEQALDAMSVAMVARCNMARADETFSYPVAEPDGMTHYRYRSLGTEDLETPGGIWSTATIEREYPERHRRSRFWAAKELDYFMVRMDHQENLFVRGRIELTSFRPLPTTDPAPVARTVTPPPNDGLPD
ncbi:MAG: DUF3108 domain-containing protein [Pseudomonadota bacterium]|nr:DUF3108 domain-containing protein [Pseudomonadota bacterium]